MQTRTRRQREVFDFIVRYIESHGYKPSYALIARHIGVRSKAGIAKHVAALEKQGLLQRRRENGSFTLDLARGDSAVGSECVIEWLEEPQNGNAEDWETKPFGLPKFVLGRYDSSSILAFRVSDDSMSDKNICEGDIALIERRSHCRDGESVVVRVKRKEILFRSFYRDGSFVELRPANDHYEMLRVKGDQVQILGVFRALVRPPT